MQQDIKPHRELIQGQVWCQHLFLKDAIPQGYN